jgi:hypothetical protein
MKTQEIQVTKTDIRQATLVDIDLPDLSDGEALVEIQGFALTTNNITYAATGDIIGYWKFFPSGSDPLGVVPAWGFATVVDSKATDLPKGTRLYGFFPTARHLILTPEVRPGGMIRDNAEHRRSLPAVYNNYQVVTDADPAEDAKRAIFHPLLVTSYLLYDFLADNDWFGAEQIIIGSASSKTGLGLCKYLAEARPNGPEVIGLTSAKNLDFVRGLSACDQVVAYGDLTEEVKDRPSVYVDMAGNADVRRALHAHLGNSLKHSAAVGTSHWDKFEPAMDLPGPKPQFFFAPSQIEKRRAEWGPGEIEKRLETAWRRVADSSSDWMRIETSQGLDAALACYKAIADGQVDPAVGHYIAL